MFGSVSLKNYSLRNGYEAHNWFLCARVGDDLGAGADEGVEPSARENCRGGFDGTGGRGYEETGGIRDEMASYSPRLEVRLDEHDVKNGGRVIRDVRLMNVVAVLPGTTQKDRQILITGHYDSLHIVRKKVGELERMD